MNNHKYRPRPAPVRRLGTKKPERPAFNLPRLPHGSEFNAKYVGDGVWVGSLQIGPSAFTADARSLTRLCYKLDELYRAVGGPPCAEHSP